MSTPSVPQTSSASASHEPELPGEPDSDKVYLGAVKSYNDRRGFGFVACAEMAAEFGRDAYMSKLEAQMAAAGIVVQSGENPRKALHILNEKIASLAEKTSEKPGNLLRVADQDIVRFMVKLSFEGFPQAVRVQRLQKFQGSVVRCTERDLSGSSAWKPGLISSQEVASKFGGNGEVVLHQEACCQVKLVPGDRVTFCIPQELEADAKSQPLQAKLVMLASTARPVGSVLGCCCLHLPRPAKEGQSTPLPLTLDCHALGSKVILSGLPMDVGEADLMRFFSKQGATKAVVAHAKRCSFASINFPSTSEVCTFLGRSTHAFADEKETRIATIQDSRHEKSSSEDEARLPALPAPVLIPGEEACSLTLSWAPLQLAVAYFLEMRPAGAKEAWAPVDTGAGAENEAGRFGADCSSCIVSGLRPGFSYEARITYYSSCGCRSEVSEASPAVIPGSERQSFSVQPMTPPHHAAYHPQPTWSSGHPYMGTIPAAPGHQAGYSRRAPAPWNNCANDTAIWPPPPPEILAGDEAGFSVVVRWPAVGQASAYVVELRESGSSSAERFVRSAEAASPGSLVELRVGGLRPIPGRRYMAQVRAVDHYGCESAPSEEGYSPPMACRMTSEGATSATSPSTMAPTGSQTPSSGPPNWQTPMPRAQPPVLPQAAPLHVPAGFAFGASGWPYSGPLPDASPISIPLAPSFSAEGAQQQGTAEARLATAVWTESPELVQSTPPGDLPMTAPAHGPPLTPPPQGPPGGMRKLEPAFEKVAEWKELPPEVTGQEECLILD